MKIIFNADDFGMGKGINSGILDCFNAGIVKSTTLVANGEAFDDAVGLALSNPELSSLYYKIVFII
jgi:predicted glycoside hydrolase/deacetylase ChbG (UPF0249 family)